MEIERKEIKEVISYKKKVLNKIKVKVKSFSRREPHKYIFKGDATVFITKFFEKYKDELNEKINKILPYNEKDVDFLSIDKHGNLEAALPGYSQIVGNGYYKYMLGRYLYAIKYIKRKSVLDAGCGLGWGAYLISEYPSELIAIDINEKAIGFAKKIWNDKKVKFRHNSVLDLNSLRKTFDVILSFEVIEHLKFDEGKLFLERVYASLRKRGFLILSSSFPDSSADAKLIQSRNEFHLKIYSKKELEKYAREVGFRKVFFVGNNISVIEK